MGGFVDRLLNSMKLNDDDDEDLFEPDEEFDAYDYDEEEVSRTKAPKKKFTRSSQREEEDLDLEEEYEAPRKQQRKPGKKSYEEQPERGNSGSGAKVMPIRRNGTMEVCMKKPTGMEDAREICDILLSGRAVVLNMEGLNLDTAQRIVDFTSGACYAIDGKMQSISRYIFIVTPPSVDLSGDFQEVFGSSFERN